MFTNSLTAIGDGLALLARDRRRFIADQLLFGDQTDMEWQFWQRQRKRWLHSRAQDFKSTIAAAGGTLDFAGMRLSLDRAGDVHFVA
jgi:hypothetical protein